MTDNILNIIQEQVEKVKAKREFTKEELYEIWDSIGFTGAIKDDNEKYNIVKSLQDTYFYFQKTNCSQGFLSIAFFLVCIIMRNENYKGDYVSIDEIYWLLNNNTNDDLIKFLNKIMRGEYIPSDDEEFRHLSNYYFMSVLKLYLKICGLYNENIYKTISSLYTRDYDISEEGKIALNTLNIDIEAEMTAVIAEYYVYISNEIPKEQQENK